MSEPRWGVRIENGKREHWDTVAASSETDAREQAARVTEVNRSWQAFVMRDGARFAKYKRGAPVRMFGTQRKEAGNG